jgi:phosphatidylinositol glycan class M
MASQYFLWYLWLLPFVIVRSRMSLYQTIFLLSAWIGGQAVWLNLAYQLEFLHQPVQRQVWLASLAFQAINVGVISQIIKTSTVN